MPPDNPREPETLSPGGHYRQATAHGRKLVTDRDLKVSVNRLIERQCYRWLVHLDRAGTGNLCSAIWKIPIHGTHIDSAFRSHVRFRSHYV